MSSFESEPPLGPAPIFSATPPPSEPHVLMGPLGLRAGWGILLFFILALGLTFSVSYGLTAARGRLPQAQQLREQDRLEREHARATHTQPPIHPVKVANSLRDQGATLAALAIAALVMSSLERRRMAVYGLALRRLRDLLPGALGGLAAMSLLVGLLRAFHLLVFDGRLLHGAAIARFGCAWLLIFLLVGITEEFLFRGYIQFTLTRGLLGLARHWFPGHVRPAAFWMSAVVWSSLFFIAHLTNPGESPAGLAGVFLGGILFSYALWRTGSLWWGIGFHMTWDWAQSFLFGVPDSGILSAGRLFATHAMGRPLFSGGADGPEGSLLLLPVLALVLVAIRLHPQGQQPPVEPAPVPALEHVAPPSSIA